MNLSVIIVCFVVYLGLVIVFLRFVFDLLVGMCWIVSACWVGLL